MTAADLFTHNRIILGMITGLAMTRILMTFANVIQNPLPQNRSTLHLLWLTSIAFELIIWWWWQLSLRYLPTWSFELVFFVTAYAVTIFMTAIMLAPDKMPRARATQISSCAGGTGSSHSSPPRCCLIPRIQS